MNKIYVAFLDENSEKVEGWFEKIDETISYIKIKTNNGSILTIPFNRVLKVKEKDVRRLS